MIFDVIGEYKRLNKDYKTRDKRPVIAITGNYDKQTCTLAEGYYQSVLRAGALPLILPPFFETECLGDILDQVDGIVFSGGGDINPLLLGEEPLRELHSVTPERDMQELLLAKLAYDRQIPMLGICKGIQIINFALGGTLYQDINSQVRDENGDKAHIIKHSQDMDRCYPSHSVTVEKESILHKLFSDVNRYANADFFRKNDTLHVNSFHHQACKDVAPCLRVAAKAPDGVIEAVESNEHKSILGVQWHPETFTLKNDNCMMPIFRWLADEAAEFKKAKELHKNMITLDSHCDTPMFFNQNIDFASRDPRILVDLHKMTEGHLDASIMVAYLQQNDRDDESLTAATAKANRILTQIEKMVNDNCGAVSLAYTPDDLLRNKREGKKSIMLGIENGYAIGKDISNVEAFRKRGVVYMTLCHNGDNDICDSARHRVNTCKPLDSSLDNGNPRGEHGGVSAFGEKVIREMNRVGMMVDLSHASEESFYDAIRISEKPIVCSHSSARALCDHPRNLTDNQMKALADAGGVAQVTFYNGFLKKEGQATIIDAVEHLNHMVNIMGIEHVGIGTDFDGDGGVPGLASASELINFTRMLLRERYTEKQIEMIWGGNFLRVMREIQNV